MTPSRPTLLRALALLLVVFVAAACGESGPPPNPGGPLVDGCPTVGDPTRLEPLLTCTLVEGSARLAVFGYSNGGTTPAAIPHGPDNRFSPELDARTLPITTRPPTTFAMGTHRAAFAVRTILSNVAWTLAGKTVSSTDDAPTCARTTIDGTTYLAAPGAPVADRVAIARDPGVVLADTIVPTQAVLAGGPQSGSHALGTTTGSFDVGGDGAATYTVPLAIPAGREGMEPELALSYASRGGNGLLGIGWSLAGLSQISRCRASMAAGSTHADPVKFDGDDRFCLDGDLLIFASDQSMRPQHDPTTRVRIDEATIDPALGPTSFTVETGAGRILRFGGPGATLEGTRVVNDASGGEGPSTAKVRLAWFVTEMRDRSSNAVRYHYESAGTAHTQGCEQSATSCVAHELRPLAITYTHAGGTGALATRRISFAYETRDDVDLAFISGFPMRRSSRIARIDVFGPAPVDVGLLRRYELAYDQAPLSGRSRLVSLRECDGGTPQVCRAPTTFGYENGSADFVEHDLGLVIGNPTAPKAVTPERPDYSNLVVADFDGDGRDDLLYKVNDGALGSWFYRLGNDTGFGAHTAAGTPSEIERVSTEPELVCQQSGASGWKLQMPIAIDLDGDGKSDLIFPYERLTCERVQPNSPVTHTFSSRQYKFLTLRAGKFEEMSFKLERGKFDTNAAAFADVNGDGLPDALVDSQVLLNVGTHFVRDASLKGVHEPLLAAALDGTAATSLSHSAWDASASHGNHAFQRVDRAPSPLPTSPLPIYPAPRLQVEDHAYTFLDVNGDGLPDLVQQAVKSDSALRLFLNTANGFRGGALSPVGRDGKKVYWGPQTARGVLSLDYHQDGRSALLVFGGLAVSTGVIEGHLGRFGLGASGSVGYDVAWLPMPRAHLITGAIGTLPTFYAPTPSWDANEAAKAHVLDVDGDGLDDLLLPVVPADDHKLHLRLYRREGKRADLLTTVRDGLGDTLAITYEAKRAQAGGCTYPIRCGARGLWVVKRHQHHVGAPAERSFALGYERPASDVLAARFLGFAERSSRDEQLGAVTTTHHARYTERVNGGTPFAFLVTKAATTLTLESGRVQTSTRETTYEVWSRPQAPASQAPRPKTLAHRARERIGSATTELASTSTSLEYDEFGNVTLQTLRANLAGTTERVRRVVRNDEARWLLGIPERLELESSVDDAPSIAPMPAVMRRVTRFETDAFTGLVLATIVEPDGGSDVRLRTTLRRNLLGQIVSVIATDDAGRRRQTDTFYDPVDAIYPIKVIGPLGHVDEAVIHSGLGLTASRTDANGVVHRFQYDGFGALRRVFAPKCTTTACPALTNDTIINHGGAHASGSYLVQTVQLGGGTSTTSFDALGRPVRSTSTAFSGALASRSTIYHAIFADLPVAVIETVADDAPLRQTFFTYDRLGRETLRTGPDGATVRTAYEGLRTRTTDPVGSQHISLVDELGRVVRSADIAGLGASPGPGPIVASEIATTFSHGPFGLLAKMVDEKKNRTRMRYDVLGRRVLLDDPDTGETSTRYDAFGATVATIDAMGRETTFAHDALGRITAEKRPDGLACFAWDAGEGAIGRIVSTVALPTKADDADPATSVMTTQTFDGFGRPVHRTQRVGGGPDLVISQTYDDFGRLARVVYPAIHGKSPTASYAYTSAGFLREVTGDDGESYWRQDRRGHLGQSLQETFGNGVVTTKQWDPLTVRLTRVLAIAGNRTIQDLAYEWRKDGNLAKRTDRSLVPAGKVETFDYDLVKRLTAWKGSGFSVGFEHDVLGNLERRTVSSKGKTQTFKFDSGPSNAASGPLTKPRPPHAVIKSNDGEYTYDRTGDQLTAPGRTIDWTTFHLPRRVTETSGTITELAYDAAHHRVSRTETSTGDQTTSFGELYERRATGGTILHVLSIVATPGVVAEIVINDALPDAIAKTKLFLHPDHLGSPHTISSKDGDVVERRLYDPFGARVDASDLTQPFSGVSSAAGSGFTGHDAATTAGLLDMRGRVFDPKVGRFASADPFIQSPEFSQSLNRYSYVFNNPINLIDPSGFFTDKPSGDPMNPVAATIGWLAGLTVGAAYPQVGVQPGNPTYQGPMVPKAPPPNAQSWTAQPVDVQPINEMTTGKVVAKPPVSAGSILGLLPRAPTVTSGFGPTPMAPTTQLMPLDELIATFRAKSQLAAAYARGDVGGFCSSCSADPGDPVNGPHSQHAHNNYVVADKAYVDDAGLQMGVLASEAVMGAEAGMARAASKVVPAALEVGERTALEAGERAAGAASHEVPQLGGAYRTVRANATAAELGGQVHHMPSWKATAEAGGATFSYGDAPGIWMETGDHLLTPSWGSSSTAAAYRAEQAALIRSGRYLDALHMDVRAVRAAHGSKYDGAIRQMGEYLWSGGF